MAKERDWVDYVNLGSNIAQNLQLHGLQHKLGGIAAAVQQEKAQAESESGLREVVFNASTTLRKLQALADEDRVATLALARANLAMLESQGVCTAAFRSYDDKERVRSLLEGFDAMAKECVLVLTEVQKEKAELCGKYLVEQNAFNLLVGLQEQQDAIAVMEAELATHEKQNAALANRRLLAAISFLLGVFFALMGGNAGSRRDENDYSFLALLALGGLFLGVGAFLVRAVVIRVKRRGYVGVPPQRITIQRIRASEPLLDPALRVIPMLQEQFGESRTSELKERRSEREALIASVLKGKNATGAQA